MSSHDLVTVVTVVFNAVSDIEDTMNSVASQTYENIEYIVVDGMSNDGTSDKIDQYASKIDVLIREKDHGIYDAMNKAILKASGEWIIFMNAGDLFHDSGVVSHALGQADVKDDFLYGDYVRINGDIKTLLKARPLDLMWQGISFSHQSLFSRTKLMKESLFSLRYSVVSDYEFYYKYYSRGAVFKYLGRPSSLVLAGGHSEVSFLRRTLERMYVVNRYGYNVSLKKFVAYYLRLLKAQYKKEFKKNSERIKLWRDNLLVKLKNPKRIFVNPKNSKVSIIMPNFNNERYVEKAVESVLSQSYRDIEIVVIDDCSTDNSVALIESFQDDRIKLYRSETNAGVAACRNKGIKYATGEYITTLDSDDCLVDKDKIKHEVASLVSGNSDALIAFSGVILMDAAGAYTGRPTKPHAIKQGNILDGIMKRSIFIPRDYLCRKQLIIDAGCFDESIPIYEDWDLKIRLAKKAEFVFSGLIGVGYRRHGTGLSSASREIHQKWIDHVREQNQS